MYLQCRGGWGGMHMQACRAQRNACYHMQHWWWSCTQAQKIKGFLKQQKERTGVKTAKTEWMLAAQQLQDERCVCVCARVCVCEIT